MREERERVSRWLQRMLSLLREEAQQMRNEAIAIEALLKDSIRTWTEWRDSLNSQVRGGFESLWEGVSLR